MKRTSVILLSLGTIIQTSPASGAAPNLDFDVASYIPKGSAIDDYITESWFFIAPMMTDLTKESYTPSKTTSVRPGDRFGFRAKFSTIKLAVKFRVELQVPSNHENFPFKIDGVDIARIDGDKVIVERIIDGRDESYSAFWGISDKDPIGQYNMNVYLEGKHVALYKFQVTKPASQMVRRFKLRQALLAAARN